MLYKLHEGYKGTQETNRYTPEQFSRQAIPFAEVSFIKGDFGSIYTQEYYWDGLGFSLTHFSISQELLVIPLNKKPELHLQFMLKGSIDCELKGHPDKLRLRENFYHVFYVPAGTHTVWFKPGEYSSFHIRLAPDWLKQFAKKYDDIKSLVTSAQKNSPAGILYSKTKLPARMKKLVNEMLRCREDSPGREIYLESKIKAILVLYAIELAQQKRKAASPARNGKRFEDILKYVNTNLADKMTINNLSKSFRLNSTKLKQLFKNNLDTSIHVYIKTQRLNKAHELLKTTSESTETISFITGFSDHSHLSREFKKHFGYTPAELRKKK